MSQRRAPSPAMIFDAIHALHTQLTAHEAAMTTATDTLNAKIDDLTGAVTDALAEIETEVAAIKAKAPETDDSAAVSAAADRISALTGKLRDGMGAARADLTASAATGASATPASVSTAAVVPLAGVPETPLSEAGPAAAGPAVPSTDHAVTDASPNPDTSSNAPVPSPATASVSGT